METKKRTQKELLQKLHEMLTELKFDLQSELSICLSDIPRDKMSKANNGKIYCNITVAFRKEPDQWGRDLKVYMHPTKQDRENRATKVYIGGGKTFIFAGESDVTPTETEVNDIIQIANDPEKGDLPF